MPSTWQVSTGGYTATSPDGERATSTASSEPMSTACLDVELEAGAVVPR